MRLCCTHLPQLRKQRDSHESELARLREAQQAALTAAHEAAAAAAQQAAAEATALQTQLQRHQQQQHNMVWPLYNLDLWTLMWAIVQSPSSCGCWCWSDMSRLYVVFATILIQMPVLPNV